MTADATAYRVQPWLDDGDLQLYHGDVLTVLRQLPAGVAQTCVTSPPYWGLRDYGTGTWTGGDPECDHAQRSNYAVSGERTDTEKAFRSSRYTRQGEMAKPTCRCGAQRVDDQLGLEPTPNLYVERMVEVFREVRRVLRADGTLWINIGDSYNANQGAGFNGQKRQDHANRHTVMPRPPGLKPKDLVGIPWRLAFALQQDGWVLRSEIIWSKPNPMPESVTDRPTKAHEQVFLFSKARWVGAERPMAMRSEDAAWLAALIDGEGTICFQERENKAHANHVGIRLSVVNTCIPLLDRVREIVGIGGESSPSPRYRNDGTSTGRPIHTWQVTNAKAAAVIAAVRPYLIAKATQADLALACHALNQKRRGHRQPVTTDAELDQKRRLAAACSKLNHGEDVDLGWFTPPKPGRWVPNAYMYDADAVREPSTPGMIERAAAGHTRGGTNGRDPSRGDADRPFGQGTVEAAGRNLRSVWQIATQPFPEAHFATYPEELVRRCILAGTSERGGCAECGAPWRRVTSGGESTYVERKALGYDQPANMRPGEFGGHHNGIHPPGMSHDLDPQPRHTTGWKPSCTCDAPATPQLVLDPFIGSGTTALVARNHARRCIGIDLSLDYLQLAARRTRQLSLLGGV